MSRCIRVTRNTLLYSLQRFHVIYRGSETCIHRLLRISTTVSRIVSCLSLCLRSYTPPRNRPVCFFNAFFSNGDKFNSFPCKILLRNLIRRLKKNKREIKYFLGLYIYIVHRFQIQFEQRPNTNCPNEAAYRVPVSFGNLIMPTFNYARSYYDGVHLLNLI